MLRHAKAAEVLEERVLLSAVYGDFNNDGNLDQAVGNGSATVNGKSSAGSVAVTYGSANGTSAPIDAQLWSQDSPGIVGKAESGDWFGSELVVGDFNNDGYDDLAIGVSRESVSSLFLGLGSNRKAGAVNIIYGSEFGLHANSTVKNQIWHQDNLAGAAESLDFFGAELNVADFNNDGYDDLAIGVPGENNDFLGVPYTLNHGGVNVIYGSANGLTVNGNQYFQQGSGIIDGTDPLGILISETIKGNAETNEYFGNSLSHGDFNGNGYDDLVVRVSNEDIGSDGIFVGGIVRENAGAVNVIYGSSSGLTVLGNQIWHKGNPGVPGLTKDDDGFGSDTIIGDFNNDGFDDLAISVPGADAQGNDNAGEVIVIYGSADRLQAAEENGAVVEAQVWSGQGGLSVEDVNGDGYIDLRIGDSIVRYGSPSGLQTSPPLFVPSDQVVKPTNPFKPPTAGSFGGSQEVVEVNQPKVSFPTPPKFLQPVPNTDGTPTTISDFTPSLVWTQVIGASEYDLLVYDKAGGFQVVGQDTLKTNSFTTQQLSAGRVYQAFVRAENAAGAFTEYSAPLEFLVTAGSQNSLSNNNSNPESPANEEGSRIVATWSSLKGVNSYDLIAYDVAKGKEVANVTESSDLRSI